MAIRKTFNVSGRTSGDVAFGTGRGQRRERDLVRAQAAREETRRVALAEQARVQALEQRQSEVAQSREDAAVAREDRLAEAERAREFTAERDVFTRAGKVADQEFGRESTTIAGRELEERRVRELALAAKHKADGDERQYTIEQQRKKDAINSSRVKVDEGLANGTYTEFQAKQFHEQFDQQELGLTKMWGPKQITPQDELQQRTFTADNGTLMYIDGAGKVQLYPGQLTPNEKLEATEKKENDVLDRGIAKEEAAFKVQTTNAKAVHDRQVAMSKSVNDFMSNGDNFDEALEKTQQIFGPPETELGETELEAERDEVADLKRLAVLRLKADLPKRKPPTQRQPIQGNIGRGL